MSDAFELDANVVNFVYHGKTLFTAHPNSCVSDTTSAVNLRTFPEVCISLKSLFSEICLPQ